MISGDADLEAGCAELASLHRLSSLEEFLGLVTSTKRSSLPSFLRLSETTAAIEEYVSEFFPSVAFYVKGLVGSDAYVDDVEVEVKGVDVLETFLIDVEGRQATLDVRADVMFTARLTYGDPDYSVYDSDLGEYVYLEETTRNVSRSVEMPVEVHITIDPEYPEHFEVDNVVVVPGQDVAIRLSDDRQ